MKFGKWRALDTGANAACANMQIDAELLQELATAEQPDIAILHLYDWQTPSVTYGHFIAPQDFLLLEECHKAGLSCAKRPTGGGIIFHLTDFAFSAIVPARHVGYSVNVLQNYAFINQMVIEVIHQFLGRALPLTLLPLEPSCKEADHARFCMAKPTKYDVMIEDSILGVKKVCGGAQRRTKHGFLHQGSISLGDLSLSESVLNSVLKPGTGILEAMREHTHPLLPAGATAIDLTAARQKIKHELMSLLL